MIIWVSFVAYNLQGKSRDHKTIENEKSYAQEEVGAC